MDIFTLCMHVFNVLQHSGRLRNDAATSGASQQAHLKGRLFMTYTQEDAYPHYTNASKEVPIDLLSIHIPKRGRVAAHTLVIADRPFEGSGQVGGGDVRAVLAELLNNQLINDSDAQACLSYHANIT